MKPTIPDYLIALNKQYGLAISERQAESHLRAVVNAWHLTLSAPSQQILTSNLPNYLQPTKRMFFSRRNDFAGVEQSEIIIQRLKAELQKTDPKEVETVLKGFFKSIKVVLDHQQKFELSKLLDKKLLTIFVEA